MYALTVEEFLQSEIVVNGSFVDLSNDYFNNQSYLV